MILSDTNINWSGLSVAFIVYSFLGALWFMILFKKPYAYALGKSAAELQNSSPLFFLGPAVCSFTIALTCMILMNALHIVNYTGALEFSCITGIGYLFANTVNIAINPNMPRPLLYGFITGMFHLVAMVLVSVIIIAFR